MNILYKSFLSIIGIGFIALITGCSPEVGSDAWCEDMKEKPKADWTSNEAGAFTKNCILK